MSCEFKKQNGNNSGGNGKPNFMNPELGARIKVPEIQTQHNRRRSTHKEQPQEPKKKPR